MHAQLQDGPDGSPGLVLELLERIEIPRVDDQRLLANRVRAGAQGHPDMRIVEVIGCADADVVDALLRRSTAQFLEMAIESLDLVEEAHFEREPIEYADRIVRVRGGDQAIAGVMDRLQMARGNIAAYSGDGKILRQNAFLTLSPSWLRAGRPFHGTTGRTRSRSIYRRPPAA